MIEEIEEEIIKYSEEEIGSPIGSYMTDLIEKEIEYFTNDFDQEELEQEFPEQEYSPSGDGEYMQEAPEATTSTWDEFMEEGFDFDILDSITQSLAATAKTSPTGLTADVFDALEIDPEEAWEQASGKKWRNEAELRFLVDTGRITDRQRQEIVKGQTSFTDNMSREWGEMVKGAGDILTALPNFVADVGYHGVTGDVEALEKDMDKIMNVGAIAADEIAASALGTFTQPAEKMRENPIDAGSWLVMLHPAAAGLVGGAKAAAGLARAGTKISKALSGGAKAGAVIMKNTSTLDTIRSAGAAASRQAQKLPGGETIAQWTHDLYAGTPEKFKQYRDYFVRDRNRDNQYIEEVILNPLQKIKKDLTDAELKDLYLAMVGNLPNAKMRKQAIDELRKGNPTYTKIFKEGGGQRTTKGRRDFDDNEKRLYKVEQSVMDGGDPKFKDYLDDDFFKFVFNDDIDIVSNRPGTMDQTFMFGNFKNKPRLYYDWGQLTEKFKGQSKTTDIYEFALNELQSSIRAQRGAMQNRRHPKYRYFKNWSERTLPIFEKQFKSYIDEFSWAGGLEKTKEVFAQRMRDKLGSTAKKVDDVVEEIPVKITEEIIEGSTDKARKMLDDLDDSNNFIEWTYDGVPMTSTEFILDTDIKKWNKEIIGMKIHPDAPAVVKQHANKLLELKRKLFREGQLQTQFKVNRQDLPSNSFLAEDYFKALAATYLPIATMANKHSKNLKDFFKKSGQAGKSQDAIGALGRLRDDIGYADPKGMTARMGGGKGDKVILSQEEFIDALELSMPRTSDAMRRYKFYDELSKSDEIASEAPKRGWVKLSGGSVMKRSDYNGGDIMRYGALDGMYVPKNVAKVIKSTERHIRDNDTALRRAMQQHRRFLNVLKHNKLIGNFSTHAHNIIGVWSILQLENISFATYMKNAKKFQKKWDDPVYRAYAETGRMPKSARGFGDVSDITNAISNVKSPKEFWDIMMKDLGDIPLNEQASLYAKGAGELGMQVLENVSYKYFGLNGHMAKFFTASDRLARYTLFKSRIEKLAKQNKMSLDKALANKGLVDEASKFATDAMLDYGDLPLGVQFFRESGLAPFIAYPYRATRYFAEYPIRKGKMYQGMEGARKGLEGSDTPAERRQRRSLYPDDFAVPLGEGARAMLGYDEPVNLSTRYWSPVPVFPRETFGMSREFGEVPELMGDASMTYSDPMSSMTSLQKHMGIEEPLNIPDTMTSQPITDLLQGEFTEAAEGILPPYAKKVSAIDRIEEELGGEKFKGDRLWGEPISLKEKLLQSVGLRVIPEEHQSHARSRDARRIKRLKGMPKYKRLSTKDKMKAEGAAILQATRNTLY